MLRLTDEKRQKILEFIQANPEMPYTQVGAKFNVHPTTACAIGREAGITRARGGKQHGRVRQKHDETVEEFLDRIQNKSQQSLNSAEELRKQLYKVLRDEYIATETRLKELHHQMSLVGEKWSTKT